MIAGQSMFGMHKRIQGMHLRLRLTTCDLKNNKKRNLTLDVGNPISKHLTWICFTICVEVTSDTMSLTLEFQRDSINDG